MEREPKSRDFYDAEVPHDANPSRLRRVILAQAHEPGGAVVLLFASATLAGTDAAGYRDEVGAVEETAAMLGLGPTAPDLFTADAYLLQSALGERLLPEGEG